MNDTAKSGGKSVPGILGAFAVASLVGGVIAAGLVAPAVGATGVASNTAVNAFLELPSELEDTAVAATTQVLAADGSLIAKFYDQNRSPVKLAQVSQDVQNAVVSIEDERFFEHSGVDTHGLMRAVAVTLFADGGQGASTLTQQLVKNTLVQQAYAKGDEAGMSAADEKTPDRKLREIRLATALEKRLTKPEILERYLNIAWFGGQTNGIEAAARYNFGTSAKKLTLPQAAMLAGMIHNPTAYKLADSASHERAIARRNRVLGKMLDLGKIDQAAHDKAVKAPLAPKITETRAGCANAKTRAYFCDYVYNVITESDDFKALGKTPEARENAFLRGGYTITTTLKPKVLKAAWNSVKDRIPPKDPSRIATATVSVEPGTGKVLSIIQNKLYNPKAARQNTTVNYSTDYQYGGSSGFQTGSTFKPVVLAAWLDSGRSLYSQLDGSSGSLPINSFKSCGQSVGSYDSYVFQNSAEGQGEGMMSAWDATKDSINGAFIRMTQQLDLCDIQKMAANLGMHRAQPVADPCIPGNIDPELKNPKMTTKVPQCEPSVALGTVSQSPMTMASAYATFASGGIRCNPVVVTSIKDRNGKKLKVPNGKCKRTISEKVANAATLGMSKVFTSGTAVSVGSLSSGQPASGKTGTTNSSQDTWFAGYTPQMATAVWVGPETVNGKRDIMQSITINGNYYPAVYGATFAGKIWKDVTSKALEGTPIKQFGDVDSSLVGSPPALPEKDDDKGDDDGGDDSDDSDDSDDDSDSDDSDDGDDGGDEQDGGQEDGGEEEQQDR